MTSEPRWLPLAFATAALTLGAAWGCGAAPGARPGGRAPAPEMAPPSRPMPPREAAALVSRFARRADACFPEVFRLSFDQEPTAADRQDTVRRQQAMTTLGQELAACLGGAGYGGRPVLGGAEVRRWLAEKTCAGFAQAAFRARRCVVLQLGLEEAGFPRATPRPVPPAAKGIRLRFRGPPPVPADGYYRASHILIFYVGATRAPARVTRTKDDARRLATRITAQAQRPGADFAALARRWSEGPSGPRGGDLGRFQPSRMVPPFSKAVQGLHPGEVTGPVETPFGFHVVRRN